MLPTRFPLHTHTDTHSGNRAINCPVTNIWGVSWMCECWQSEMADDSNSDDFHKLFFFFFAFEYLSFFSFFLCAFPFLEFFIVLLLFLCHTHTHTHSTFSLSVVQCPSPDPLLLVCGTLFWKRKIKIKDKLKDNFSSQESHNCWSVRLWRSVLRKMTRDYSTHK